MRHLLGALIATSLLTLSLPVFAEGACAELATLTCATCGEEAPVCADVKLLEQDEMCKQMKSDLETVLEALKEVDEAIRAEEINALCTY